MSSGSAERAPTAAREIVRTAARAFERDRYLAALLGPRDVRDDLIALAAFAGELARIPGYVSEPTIGEIRLQWWRDTLDAGLATGLPTDHPIADALCAAARRHAIAATTLHELIDAQSDRLEDRPFADEGALLANLARWDGGLFRLAWRMIADPEDASGDPPALLVVAGEAYGLARLLVEAPAELAQGRCLLPRDLLARHSVAAEALHASSPAPGLAATAAATATTASERLSLASRLYRAAPRAARIAALPLALVRPYLTLSQRVGVAAAEAQDIGPLTRVWRLWATSLTGRP